MAHVLLDRAKVVATSMTGTLPNYTLTNAPPTGFVDFTGVGDGNTTFYVAEDDTGLFEIGVGTFATSGEVLTRTDGNVILSSNNGNNDKVNWPSNSTPTVFISQLADKAVSLDNVGDLTLTGANYNVTWDKSADALKFPNGAELKFGTSDALTIKQDADGTHSRIIESGSGNLVVQAQNFNLKTSNAGKDYLKCINDGAVELYHNDVKKIETTSTGIALSSDDDGSGTEPVQTPIIELYRNCADPQASDYLGTIDFYGEDDNDDKVKYASVYSTIFHPTEGNERGFLHLAVMQNGNFVDFMRMGANGINLYKTATFSNNFHLNNADTTFSRVSAGVAAIEGNNILTTATGATTGKAIAMAMVFG